MTDRPTYCLACCLTDLTKLAYQRKEHVIHHAALVGCQRSARAAHEAGEAEEERQDGIWIAQRWDASRENVEAVDQAPRRLKGRVVGHHLGAGSRHFRGEVNHGV